MGVEGGKMIRHFMDITQEPELTTDVCYISGCWEWPLVLNVYIE